MSKRKSALVTFSSRALIDSSLRGNFNDPVDQPAAHFTMRTKVSILGGGVVAQACDRARATAGGAKLVTLCVRCTVAIAAVGIR